MLLEYLYKNTNLFKNDNYILLKNIILRIYQVFMLSFKIYSIRSIIVLSNYFSF